MGDRKVFVIYVAHRCVMDRGTMCSTNGFIRKTPVHSNVKPPGDVHDISDNSSKYIDFVAAFPRITETNLGKVTLLAKPLYIDTGEAVPVASPCRPLHGDEKKAMEAKLPKLENEGIIERCESEWASPIHSVEKLDGSWRVCGDFRL